MSTSKVDLYEGYAAATALSDTEITKMLAWGGQYFEHLIRPHFGSESKDLRILEIGCGNGRFVKYLEEQGFEAVEGIDISQDQIDFAKKKFKLTSVSVQDTLPYLRKKKKTYDVIYLVDVVEHLELEYLVELGRCIHERLAPGGRLIMQAPNGLAPLSPNRFSDVTHLRAYTDYSFTQLQKMFGFETVANYELPPFVHGLKSRVRCTVWRLLLKPGIKLYMLLANGDAMGSIYTANILSVGIKSR